MALTSNDIGMASNESDPQFSQYKDLIKVRLEKALHLVGNGHVITHINLNPAGELKNTTASQGGSLALNEIAKAIFASQPFGEVPLDGYKSTDLIQFDIEIIWSKLHEHQHQNVYVYLAHQE
jgi:hypothetical protein